MNGYSAYEGRPAIGTIGSIQKKKIAINKKKLKYF
jgi:hypothetical protein